MKTHVKIILAVGVPILILALTQFMGWEGGYFQVYYVLPIATIAPWLVIHRLDGSPPGHRVLLVDFTAVLLAGLRIFSPGLPASGHILFLLYSGVTVRNRWYRIAAGAAFLEAAWLKVVVWNEEPSFYGGVLVGGLLILMAGKQSSRPKQG